MPNYNDEWMAVVLGPLILEGKLEPLINDKESKTSLWERVLDARLLTEAEVLDAVAYRCKLPIADLSLANEAGRDALPEPLARRYGVIPLGVTDSLLDVATSNPFDVGAEQSLAFATGREVRMVLASPPRIRERLDQLYGQARRDGSVKDLLTGMEAMDVTELPDEMRVLEAVQAVSSSAVLGGVELSASQLAERFGFANNRQWTPVRDLSGGERRRLQLRRRRTGPGDRSILRAWLPGRAGGDR